MESTLNSLTEQNRIEVGNTKFEFTGSQVPSSKEAIKILDTLEQLTELQKALKKAIEDGDLFNLDLANLAKFLGAESYQEFIERRARIFQSLKEILEKNRNIVQKEDGELGLSPRAIRKIGMTAVAEIFSKLPVTLQSIFACISSAS